MDHRGRRGRDRLVARARQGQRGAAGGATELLLAMLRRVPLAETRIELFGDDGVWRRWLDHTPL